MSLRVDAYQVMRKLVYAFYNEAFSFGRVLRKHPNLRSDVTYCLVGNLFCDFDPLFEAIGEFAEIPDVLDYGEPLDTVPEVKKI